jgi:hypothetical protein
MTKISSIKQLKELCLEENGPIDCFIQLGALRSSKSICFDDEDGKFSIINEIDDSEDILSPSELLDKSLTNIGEAIQKGCFYMY